MANSFLSPNGQITLDLVAGTYLSVRSVGASAEVLEATGPGVNVPSTFSQAALFSGERVFYYSGAKKVRIVAGSAPVQYGTSTVPTVSGAEFWPEPPSAVHSYFNDFNQYTATDWAIQTTEAGAGSATEAITNGVGGLLLITNDNADNDLDFFQLASASTAVEGFKFRSGKRMWFEMRFATNDATETDIVCGLQITDTTPLAVSDGVYFLKSDGAATADFIVTKDSTSTTASAVATLANDTYVILGFYYDGASTISYYVNRVLGGTVATTNMPDDEDLTISFGIQNGAAAAKTLTVDYVYAAQDR